MKIIARLILKILGWKVDDTPKGIPKAVIVMGPHTSNWDFIIGKLAFINYGIKTKILIKKEAFIFPFGWILKATGGVPVDRKKKNNITDQAVKFFNENESVYMIFTPEGTRKYNPSWKRGFYHIAIKAKVPIYIGYMDYKTKRGGFHSVFEPSGNVEKDIILIKEILSQYTAKHPENGIRHPSQE